MSLQTLQNVHWQCGFHLAMYNGLSKARYPFVQYSALFHISPWQFISFHVALFSSCIFFMLHSFHVALFSCCTFFVLHFFHVALFSCCTFFMLHSFHVALFSYCTISMLHFSCSNLFMLHFFVLHSFYVLHCFLLHLYTLQCFRLTLISCMRSSHVVIFSCCTLFMLMLCSCFVHVLLEVEPGVGKNLMWRALQQ